MFHLCPHPKWPRAPPSIPEAGPALRAREAEAAAGPFRTRLEAGQVPRARGWVRVKAKGGLGLPTRGGTKAAGWVGHGWGGSSPP